MSMRRTRVLVALLALAAACTGRDAPPAERPPANPDPTQNTYAPALGVTLPSFTKSPEGLYTLDTAAGEGDAATPGRRVTVHYTGWLPDGSEFDSSRKGNSPFTFTLGAGEVITGWDLGVAGMRVGGRRKLVIPPDLGYGAAGAPPDIPANSVLVFDVEMVEIR